MTTAFCAPLKQRIFFTRIALLVVSVSPSSVSVSPTMDPMFTNTLNPYEHEIHQLIRLLLMSRDSQKRSEVLKSLRKSLKKCQNILPQLCHEELFDAILQILKEEKKPSVICECLWLIVDVIPSIGHSLDRLLAPILIEVVPLLGMFLVISEIR